MSHRTIVATTIAIPRATDSRNATFMTAHASMRAMARSTRRGASLRMLETWSLMGFLPGRTSYLPGYRIAWHRRWFRAALAD